MTPFATATPTNGRQPSAHTAPVRRCHGCTVVATTTAIIRTRHTRALRRTLSLARSLYACGHLALPTDRSDSPPLSRHPSAISPTKAASFERRYGFKFETVRKLYLLWFLPVQLIIYFLDIFKII